MPNQTVTALSASFGISFSLLKQFIKICPKNIWEENFGGWPIWQQVYHALDAVNFFVLGSGLPASNPPLPQEVGSLDIPGENILGQEEMLHYANEMEEKGKAFLSSLNVLSESSKPTFFTSSSLILLARVSFSIHSLGT